MSTFTARSAVIIARIRRIGQPGAVHRDRFLFKDPRNEPTLLNLIQQGIETALNGQATILVFPELSFTPAMLERAR
jgi:hypothetical protein